MASFASSATTGGVRKHAWTNLSMQTKPANSIIEYLRGGQVLQYYNRGGGGLEESIKG